MVINDIEFDMNWQQGHSPRKSLPRNHGVYCEVTWPVRGIRIGISRNIWARHGGAASWMRSMQKGTGSRTNRVGPYANHAKDWGSLGLETFVLSTDRRLLDDDLRYDCETQLHKWAEEQTGWKNFNGEKWKPKNYGIPVIDEATAAKVWGVDLNWTLE